MKKLILSEKGAILLLSTAVIVILISVISSVSLIGLVRFDNAQVQYANDVLQAETLLRSEQSRTNIILKNDELGFNASDHKVEIESNGRYTTYSIDNQQEYSGSSKRIGKTLIDVRRGKKNQSGSIEYDGVDYKASPIRRYAETELSGKSLAQYQYFTMNEYSENDEYNENDYVKFYGYDVLNGPVHSNTNIYIQNVGGWPTFNALVTTNGIIMDYNNNSPQPAVGNVPMDEIFLGGYMENAGYQNMSNGVATDIRMNGHSIEESHEHDIMFAKISGTNIEYKFGDIETTLDTFIVYNSFPQPPDPLSSFPVGDSIWTNFIEVKEIEWEESTSSINVNGASVMVYCQLWIEGEVGSQMTFGCSDTIFITNDLYYQDIPLGSPPDDVANYSNILGLVSEERIYIQYKNWDPIEEEYNAGNCDDIYLYGCFAAIGDGDLGLYGNLNTHYEGIFSFYYQHPHGSTPGFTYTYPNGNTWEVKYPDFHKFIFPPSPYWQGDEGFLLHGNDPVMQPGFYTCGYPYEDPGYASPSVPPYGTDWPWYNPVWPEGANTIVGERGYIHMYGGVQQYRRGFVHRSGTDTKNHQNNIWDVSHWLYDGMHGETGYDKDYNWDSRIDDGLLPPDYPEVYEGMGSAQLYYSSTGWAMKAPPRN